MRTKILFTGLLWSLLGSVAWAATDASSAPELDPASLSTGLGLVAAVWALMAEGRRASR